MDNPLLFLLLGLLVTWVGSYFYSILHNRRRLRLLAQWLQPALPLLGPKWNSRWQGADRLDVLVNEGRGNFRETALVLAMQSRQLFKALVSTLRGGRDSLTLLASLQRGPAPGGEFEIFETGGQFPRNVAAGAASAPAWEVWDYPRAAAYKIAARSQTGREAAARLLTLLLDDGFQVRRVSLRPSAPHIMLVLNLGRLPQVEAAALLRLVKNLADEADTPAPQPPAGRERTPRQAGRQPSTAGKEFSSNGHKKPQ